MESNIKDLYLKAQTVAKNAHGNQRYGSQNYFEYHVMGVVRSLVQVDAPYKYLIVACLHDTLEDTWLGYTHIKQDFGCEIADAVIALTKLNDESRNEYLARCRSNDIARVVKLHDATFNATQCHFTDQEKFNYYIDTISKLRLSESEEAN